MFDRIAIAVLFVLLVLSFWSYRRAAVRKQADTEFLGGTFFHFAVWFLYFVGKVVDNLPFRMVVGAAALASLVISFRMMRRHGKAQKAKVEEEYQRFLETRKNQATSQTPR